MSRHDWRAIAQQVSHITDEAERDRMAFALADYFAAWYKAFDRAKWLEGCGYAVLRA